MAKVALRGLLTRKLRLGLTALAIALGVTLIAGTYVFTDTINRSFDRIFADEPTGNLDSKSSGELLDLLRRSVDEFGQTVIMVTHDPTAASYADRLLVLGDGRVVHDGEAESAEAVLDLMKAVG